MSTSVTDVTDRLTTADVAALVGVRAAAVRGYHSKGTMPAPTGKLGRTPWWSPADVQPWIDDVLTKRADRARPNESKEK